MKPFTTVAFAILLAAGLAHVVRLIAGFEVVIAGHYVPLWASAVGGLIALIVAFQLRREAKR